MGDTSLTHQLERLQSLQILTYTKNDSLLIKLNEIKVNEIKLKRESEPEKKTKPNAEQKSLAIKEESKPAQLAPSHQLLELWNDFCGSLPKAKALSAARKKQAVSLWRTESNEAYWVEVIKKIQASDFCTGNNDRSWVATFDWFLKADTHLKVTEGKYDTRNKQGYFMTNAMKISHNNQHRAGKIQDAIDLFEGKKGKENEIKKDVGSA